MKKWYMFLIIIAAMFLVSPAFAEWDGEVTLGASLSSGVNDSMSSSISAKAVQREGNERYSSSILYNYAETEGTITARNIFSAVKYDQFVTENFYTYLSVEVLSNKLKNINMRTIIGPGIGLQVIEDKGTSLSVEAGVSYFSEDLVSGLDERWYTARVGATFKADLWGVTLSDALTANLSIEDIETYQLRNEASVALPLSSEWALKLSNVLQYDNTASQKTDQAWTAGIMYNF